MIQKKWKEWILHHNKAKPLAKGWNKILFCMLDRVINPLKLISDNQNQEQENTNNVQVFLSSKTITLISVDTLHIPM